jgi:exopolyphosphatase/guanosine-5'-triphosphate,3'-diphosphate pyrophosphatase
MNPFFQARFPMQDGTRLAAVDLGSNSFRLEIGRLDHGLIHRTEYLKETVRQGAGLDAQGLLSQDAMERGWACLARFGEQLTGFQKHQVRAVATQTLREARNREAFLERAQRLLGFAIDVVPGREEARLIYQGVAHLLPQSEERRLVVDIGGRSTEMVLGQGFAARRTASWPVGSVSWSQRYFADGQFSARAFEAARVAALAVLEDALPAYQRSHWDSAYGSSGTANAVAEVLAAAGWPQGCITREGLDWLQDRLIKLQSADRLRLEGLKEDRRAVVGGGVSVLRAVFELLDIEEMQAAQGALRHGALYDLLEREHTQTDVRSRTVERLSRRFGVDAVQARRVSEVARQLLAMAPPAVEDYPRLERKLDWAAQLHEIGCHISHEDHHKHGAYILAHADAPGFALDELQRLSLLVLGQRGKLRKVEAELDNPVFARQLLALRLAAILAHARRDPDLQALSLQAKSSQVQLHLPPGWSTRYPQSYLLLQDEEQAWQKTPYPLRVLQADAD